MGWGKGSGWCKNERNLNSTIFTYRISHFIQLSVIFLKKISITFQKENISDEDQKTSKNDLRKLPIAGKVQDLW